MRAPAVVGTAIRARLDAAGAQVGGGLRRDRARLLQPGGQRLAVADVAVDVAAGDVVADDAARALIRAADRLVQRARDLHAELLAHGERVERGLDLAVLCPARARVDGPALVVADDRPRAVRVDAVDAPADPDAVDHQRGRLVAAEAPLELRRLVTGAVRALV